MPEVVTGRLTKATLDTRAQTRFLARYTNANVEQVLTKASKKGGTEAAKVLRAKAPIGTARRLSQYYRRKNLVHGTFQKTVTSRAIKGRGQALRGIQGRTVGVIIGPLGANAFTRRWIEGGTVGPGRHRQRANPWVEEAAAETLEVAKVVSEGVLEAYARE